MSGCRRYTERCLLFSFSYPICLCVKKVPCSVLEYIRRQYKPATGRRIRKHDTGLLFFFRLWSELLCRPFAIFFGRSNNSSIGPFQTFSFQWVLSGFPFFWVSVSFTLLFMGTPRVPSCSSVFDLVLFLVRSFFFANWIPREVFS